MKVSFDTGLMCLEAEDEIDNEYLDGPLTLEIIKTINEEMRCGPPCGRLTNKEAEEKIFYMYREYLKHRVEEMRNDV